MNLKEFLWPSKIKLVVFGVFLLLVLLGSVQAEGFTEGPRSSLYYLIKDFPFWIIMVYLSTPTMFVTIPLALIEQSTSISLGVLVPPIVVAYFYLLSCVLEVIVKKLTNKSTFK